jgi:hypothetical protein
MILSSVKAERDAGRLPPIRLLVTTLRAHRCGCSLRRVCANLPATRGHVSATTSACVRVAHRDVSFRSVENDAGTVPDSLLRWTSLPIRPQGSALASSVRDSNACALGAQAHSRSRLDNADSVFGKVPVRSLERTLPSQVEMCGGKAKPCRGRWRRAACHPETYSTYSRGVQGLASGQE